MAAKMKEDSSARGNDTVQKKTTGVWIVHLLHFSCENLQNWQLENEYLMLRVNGGAAGDLHIVHMKNISAAANLKVLAGQAVAALNKKKTPSF